MIPFIECSGKGKTIKAEDRSLLAGVGMEGRATTSKGNLGLVELFLYDYVHGNTIRGHMQLSKPTQLYTTKGKFYCVVLYVN